jgi:8-oxo-dGTP diphosphatase / 2-hydroxy-dATP diphosphatase
MKKGTWMFVVKNGRILLAMKKRGFGAGKWNAPGGKVQRAESIEQGAIRETKEELGITVEKAEKAAEIEFQFKYNPEWNMTVFGFMAKKWHGEARETEEMAPKWFKFSEIPYERMWRDDEVWLKQVLAGKKVKGKFVFGENDEVLEYKLNEQS